MLLLGLLGVAWLGRLMLGDDHLVTVVLHGLAPWWAGVAAPALIAALWTRDRALIVLAVLGLLADVVLVWPPDAVPTPATPPAQRVVLVTANAFGDNPQVDTFLNALARQHADVIVLPEVHTGWAPHLDHPVLADLPHRYALPRSDFFGATVLSRWPIATAEEPEVEGITQLVVGIDAPGGRLRLIAAHLLPPYRSDWLPRWQRQLGWLAGESWRQRTVAAGDLNATPFHPSFHQLTDAGWTDAAPALGRTAPLTWPQTPWPLMALDHVLLTPDLTALDVQAIDLPGSDHLGLRVEFGW